MIPPTSGNRMDLTISIVNYNTADVLKKCLQSVRQHTHDLSYEIIVVDNASKDGSVPMILNEFPWVQLIANPDNLYFTRANNQALERAHGRYQMILNPDTY
ncbi:MAG: glycosyltransferase, partial [Elusimicrobia bacterium]|nr:glycosyltransferase [Elusimicrobiota bacterium]